VSLAAKWLLCILLGGLLLRVAYAAWLPADEKTLGSLPDQAEYLQCARASGAGEKMSYFDPRFGQRVYAARTPGYPLLLRACGSSIRGARLAQALLDTATALGAFVLARRLGLGKWSLLAAAGVALNPLLVYFSSLLLTETLYVCMLTWAMALLAYRRWLPAALLLALGVLVRTSGLPLALLLPPLAALLLCGWRRALAAAVVSAAVVFAVLLPWAMRNEGVLGQRVWLSTNGGITLYDGVHPAATGASDQRFVSQFSQLAQMTELERDQFFSRLAWEQICGEPGRVLRLALVKAGRTWSPLPLSDSFGRPLYVVAGLAWSLPVFGLALAGVVQALRRKGAALAVGDVGLLLLPMLLFTLMHAISVGSLRYRMPVEPLLAVLAAAALRGLLEQSSRPSAGIA